MIVLRTPKGWTGPKVVDGMQVEGTFRAHQVPLADMRDKPEHLKMLEDWMKSYQPGGTVRRERHGCMPELAELAPKGERRMGANPHANGGLLLQRPAHARLPRLRGGRAQARRRRRPRPRACMGEFLRDVMKLNADAQNFRVFGPDETASNRWTAVFEVTNRAVRRPRSCPTTTTSRPTAA